MKDSRFCVNCGLNVAMYRQGGRHKCPSTLTVRDIAAAAHDVGAQVSIRLVEPGPVFVGLPDDDAARKALPIFDGFLMYFPDAAAAVAEVSRIGNEQHNPGEPLHWARGKSMDQYNTALRHMMDHRMGKRYNGAARHLANAAWRIMAALQLDIEAERDDTRRQSQSTGGPVSQGSPCLLPETRTERDGRTSIRLPRDTSRARVRRRNKGVR